MSASLTSISPSPCLIPVVFEAVLQGIVLKYFQGGAWAPLCVSVFVIFVVTVEEHTH